MGIEDIYRKALEEADELLAGYEPDHRLDRKQAEDSITVSDQIPAKVIRKMVRARQVIRQALREGADALAADFGGPVA